MAPSAADDKLNDEEKSILIDAVKAYPILSGWNFTLRTFEKSFNLN